MASLVRGRARWAVIASGVLLAAIQLVPVDRSTPETHSELWAPEPVATILTTSCYDCHSYRTRWPWYGYVAPASWWLSRHVHRGRRDLNFSDWPSLDLEIEGLLLRTMKEQITAGHMPLRSYTLVHRDAVLDDDERSTVLAWIAGRLDDADDVYP